MRVSSKPTSPRLASALGPSAKQVEASAWLVAEPGPARPIAIWIGGGQVGHMAAPHALAWHPAIVDLAARYSRAVACFAKIVAGGRLRLDNEVGHYAVRLFLPPPPL